MQPANLHAEEGEVSWRCLFLAVEFYKDAGSRKFVEPFGQQLHSKGVNFRKHANRDLIDPVLSEVAQCIENEVHRK